MDDELAIDWLRLVRSPHIGAVTIGRLIHHLGDPAAILGATRKQLSAIPAMPGSIIRAIEGFRREVPVQPIAHELQRLHAAGGCMLIPGTADFPAQLSRLHDPPPMLFAMGNTRLLHQERLVTITGTRSASPRGMNFAANLARDLTQTGLVTVSGLAAGIDAAAHTGALENDGPTIAVLATGLDIVHPREHGELQKRIATQGCLISEAPLGLLPVPWAFPARARILAGLVRGVVIVEAPERSGALLTAQMALEQGRDVFAVPGPPNDPNTRGTHALLRQGARLLEGINDLLEEFQWSPALLLPTREPGPTTHLPDQVSRLLTHLHNGATHEDDLARCCHLTVAELSRMLLQLELSGLIERQPGGRYAVIDRS